MGDIHVVLGASGGAGSAIAKVLAGSGHRVRAVNRTGDADVPNGVERTAADVTNSDDARRAVRDAAVVYHAAQPRYTRWVDEFPAMNRTIVDATAAEGAKLVFADNLYLYEPGSDGMMTEGSSLRTRGKKSLLRARMAEELLSAHREGRLHVSIGRSSDYFGPGGRDSAIGERLFGAIIAGKKASWLGSLDVPHTVAYTEDVGRAIVMLGERPDADGRAWNLPAADPPTGREFLTLAFQKAGRPPRFGTVSPGLVRLAGLFRPMIREVVEVTYQWTGPFVSDWSQFRDTFGPFATTPLPEAVTTTLEWFGAQAGRGARKSPS
jgi:nucleoside-diphosphate-sugar epimerase